VHLVERGRDIRISVRSSDPALTHAMRRDLGELVTKLESRGFEAKVSHSHEHIETVAQGLNSPNSQLRGDATGAGAWNADSDERGGNGGSGQQQHQGQRHGNPHRWLAEFSETTGEDSPREKEDEWR
jgi:hypothetical protein